MKAIPTHYKQHLFRSRLEARWAIFFDALGIRWQYEPEGYDLGNAGWYLPDFWLPDMQFLVEIKPTPEAARADTLQYNQLSYNRRLIVLSGTPDSYEAYDYEGNLTRTADLGQWGECPTCNGIRFGFRCAGEFVGTTCSCRPFSDQFGIDSQRIRNAVTLALSARFRYGVQR